MARGRLAILVLVLLGLSRAAAAQHGTAQSGPTDASGVHSWACIPAGDGWTVVHFPPRGAAMVGSVSIVTADGVGLRAASIRERPEAMAAVGRDLVLIFPAAGADRPLRPVLGLSAAPAAFGDSWTTTRSDRLRPLPPLPAGGRVVAATGTTAGAVVILRRPDEAGVERDELLRLTAAEWVRLEAPGPAVWGTRRVLAAAQLEGALAVLAESETGGIDEWSRSITADGWEPESAWTRRSVGAVPGPDAAGGQTPPGAGVAFTPAAGGWAWARPEETGAVAVRAESLEASRVLAVAEDAGRDWFLVGAGSRVILGWAPRSAAGVGTEGTVPTPASLSRCSLIEASAQTGREFYRGPVRGSGPISAVEFRAVLLALLGLTALVLVFTLRSDRDAGVCALPAGVALAESSRRVMAGFLDFGVAFIAVRLVADIRPEWLLGFTAMARSVIEPGAAMALGFAHCWIAESLWGRSLGKQLTGCRVVRIMVATPTGAEALRSDRPGLRRSLIRNVVRWLLPPVAWIGLASRSRRHRGDVLAGTAVVIDAVEPAGSEGGGPPGGQ